MWRMILEILSSMQNRKHNRVRLVFECVPHLDSSRFALIGIPPQLPDFVSSQPFIITFQASLNCEIEHPMGFHVCRYQIPHMPRHALRIASTESDVDIHALSLSLSINVRACEALLFSTGPDQNTKVPNVIYSFRFILLRVRVAS